jgi:hypothetical protein
MLEIHFIIISIEIIIFIVGIAVLWFYKQKWVQKSSESYKELYSDYLNSEKWDSLKKLALERADYKCELCGATYKAVHHVKYPKKYQNDHIDNLLVVCGKCHAKLHGIRDIDNNLNNNGNSFSETVILGSRSYSFDVNTILGKKCLIITESGKRGNRQIEIFLQKFHELTENLSKALLSLQKDIKEPFYETMSVNENTYFFDIKVAVNGSKYLTITTSKRTANNLFERHSIIVFDDESRLFSMCLNKVINYFSSVLKIYKKR